MGSPRLTWSGTHLERQAAGAQGAEVVVSRRVEDAGHLPRRLSEVRVRTLADTSASLNPDLACTGCPQSDTRVPVNDTEEMPWDALGLLARQDANDISKCPPPRFAHRHLPSPLASAAR